MARTKTVPAKTPMAGGMMLWCVHYASSYYDSDPRWSSTVPVDVHSFVLAHTLDEAIAKAQPEIRQGKKRADRGSAESITATVVSLENLIPARNSSNDGRLGWISTAALMPVQLCKADAKKYRLAVHVVPLKK